MKTYDLNNNEFISLEDLPFGTNDMLVKVGHNTFKLRVDKDDTSYIILYKKDGHTKSYFATKHKRLYIDKELILKFDCIAFAYADYSAYQKYLG